MSKVVTNTTEYFTIAELKEKGLSDIIKKICDDNRYAEVELYNWYEFIYDEFKEDMKKYGIRVSNIYFSGFSSQGDGAIFEVDSLDIIEFLQDNKLITKFKEYFNEMKKDIAQNYYGHPIKNICTNQLLGHRYLKIKQSGHYYHEKSYTIDYDYYYDSQDDFENYLKDFIETKARELYKNLEKEYDNYTSNEYILESLENNDCMFTIDGEVE